MSMDKLPDLTPTIPVTDEQERNWAMLCQLSALLGALLIPPVGGILLPLAIWWFKSEDLSFVNSQGKEVINFQISIFLAICIATPLVFIGIGYVLLPLIAIANFVLVIVAAVRNKEGLPYLYPWTLRLIK